MSPVTPVSPAVPVAPVAVPAVPPVPSAPELIGLLLWWAFICSQISGGIDDLWRRNFIPSRQPLYFTSTSRIPRFSSLFKASKKKFLFTSLARLMKSEERHQNSPVSSEARAS